MFQDENVKYEELGKDRRYRYFNFGMLHGKGLGRIFNFMRYNIAFLARHSDLELLREAAQDYRDWMQRPYSILLCKYDWAGKTKASWYDEICHSDQSFDPITSVGDLYDLNSDNTSLKPASPLKSKTEATAKGTLRWILQAMYDNQAMPYQETDACKMEHAMSLAAQGINDPIEVVLANYKISKTEWTWHPVPKQV